MPRNPLPCPSRSCTGEIKVRNSGPLAYDQRTGLLARECLVACTSCRRKGKMLVTLDIALYPDEEGEALPIEPTLFPTAPAA